MAPSTSLHDHHQVCQLVNNDHDQWEGSAISDWALYSATLGIKASNITTYFREELVAIFSHRQPCRARLALRG